MMPMRTRHSGYLKPEQKARLDADRYSMLTCVGCKRGDYLETLTVSNVVLLRVAWSMARDLMTNESSFPSHTQKSARNRGFCV